MLTALRRAAGSFVAKILFVVLIVSFAVWGIGDIFRGRSGDVTVATIGPARVTLEEALEEYRRELSQITRQFAGQFEPTAEIRRVIAEQVATRLAAGRAIDQEAGRMGLAVSDEALREAVFALPVFAGPDGRFNRLAFENFLRSQALTEGRFLAILRADLGRQALIGAVRGGATAPAVLARGLLAHAGEARIAEIAGIETATMPDPPAPDEGVLRRWYDTNTEDFMAPELRALTVAVIGPAQLAGEVAVSAAELEAAFAARRGEFEQAERRDADQLQFTDEATAGIIAAQWRLGAAWEAIAARTAEAGGTALRLGSVARAGVPIPALAAALFGAEAPGVVGPVRTPFGWAVLRVNRIEPGRTATLEEVAPRLAAAIAQERAAELVYARERRIEDALAGGASLAEVAAAHGMVLFRTAGVSRQGRDEAGLAVDLGPAAPQVLASAFAARAGDEPRMVEAPGAVFFAVRVEGITPAAPRPFDEVREAVLAAWTADARARAAEERATALMTAARAPGASLAAAAAEAGIPLQRTPPIPRPAPRGPQVVPPELARALFALPAPGEASMVRTPAGFAVVGLVEIIPAPEDQAALAAMTLRASQALGEDIEQVFVDALRARAGVALNPRGLDLLAQP